MKAVVEGKCRQFTSTVHWQMDIREHKAYVGDQHRVQHRLLLTQNNAPGLNTPAAREREIHALTQQAIFLHNGCFVCTHS